MDSKEYIGSKENRAIDAHSAQNPNDLGVGKHPTTRFKPIYSTEPMRKTLQTCYLILYPFCKNQQVLVLPIASNRQIIKPFRSLRLRSEGNMCYRTQAGVPHWQHRSCSFGLTKIIIMSLPALLDEKRSKIAWVFRCRHFLDHFFARLYATKQSWVCSSRDAALCNTNDRHKTRKFFSLEEPNQDSIYIKIINSHPNSNLFLIQSKPSTRKWQQPRLHHKPSLTLPDVRR